MSLHEFDDFLFLDENVTKMWTNNWYVVADSSCFHQFLSVDEGI